LFFRLWTITIYLFTQNRFSYEKNYCVLSFFLSFFPSPLNAQGDVSGGGEIGGSSFSCGNESPVGDLSPASLILVPDYDDWIASNSFDPQSTNPIFTSSYSIPLHIVIVAQDDGTLPFFTHSVQEQVDYMNSLFTNGMSFYICDIDIENNSELFDINLGGETGTLYDLNHTDDAINVYFTNTVYDDGGRARFPWNNDNDDSNAVFIKASEHPRTLTHEMGHCFGLHHTHNCTVNNPSPINTAEPDYPGELVNGSNSHLAADRMIDTPADPGHLNSIQSQVGECSTNNCNGTLTCVFTATNLPLVDPNNQPYNPDITNVMSYYPCGTYNFTPKQLELMELVLLNEPSRNFLLNSNPNYCNYLPIPQIAQNANIDKYCNGIGAPFVDQKIEITSQLQMSCVTETNIIGSYNPESSCILGLGNVTDVNLAPLKSDPDNPAHVPLLAVTTYDIVKISSHILGTSLFDSPYKWVAADANNDGNITGTDITAIRAVILHIYDTYPAGVWRFIPEYYFANDNLFDTNFHTSLDPFAATTGGGQYCYHPNYAFAAPTCQYSIMDQIDINLQSSIALDDDTWSFRAVKVGDVTCGAFNQLKNSEIESRDKGNNILTQMDMERCFSKGEYAKLEFSVESQEELLAYQMGFKLDNQFVSIEDVILNGNHINSLENFNIESLKNGELRHLWFDEKGGVRNFGKDKLLFELEVIILDDICDLTDVIKLDNNILDNHFYAKDGSDAPVSLFIELKSDGGIAQPNKLDEVNVFPNPFSSDLTFEIKSKKDEKVTIQFFDCIGKTIAKEIELQRGKHTYTFDELSSLGNGILFYRIQGTDFNFQGKVIKLD